MGFMAKDWEKTLFYLNRMIQKDPTDPYLDANLVYIYARRGSMRTP